MSPLLLLAGETLSCNEQIEGVLECLWRDYRAWPEAPEVASICLAGLLMLNEMSVSSGSFLMRAQRVVDQFGGLPAAVSTPSGYGTMTKGMVDWQRVLVPFLLSSGRVNEARAVAEQLQARVDETLGHSSLTSKVLRGFLADVFAGISA
jgi:hypothetical protein